MGRATDLESHAGPSSEFTAAVLGSREVSDGHHVVDVSPDRRSPASVARPYLFM
jgi:hypothetical protein